LHYLGQRFVWSVCSVCRKLFEFTSPDPLEFPPINLWGHLSLGLVFALGRLDALFVFSLKIDILALTSFYSLVTIMYGFLIQLVFALLFGLSFAPCGQIKPGYVWFVFLGVE